MKILKSMLLGLLNLLLITFITSLIVSFNLKNFLSKGIVMEVVKSQIATSYTTNTSTGTNDTDSSVTDIANTNNEEINRILESKEAQELVNKYIDVTINGVIDTNNLTELELENDILKFLNNNKDELEKALGVEITDEMLSKAKSDLESKEMSRVFKQTITNTSKNTPKEVKYVLKGYNFIISTKFKIILLLLILLDLVFIALLQKPYYQVIRALGVALITSGLCTLSMAGTVGIFVSNLSKSNLTSRSPLIISSIISIVLGIIMIVVKHFIERKATEEVAKERKQNDEVPEILE